MSQELKVCRKCHLELPVEDFAILSKVSGNRRRHCRSCENARVRQYYANNEGYRARVRANAEKNRGKYTRTAAQQRAYMLKGKYGITQAQYDELLSAQGGRCALCKTTEVGRGGPESKWKSEYFHIDHCHTNGHVRGLLCHLCNTRLGSYEAMTKEIGEAVLVDYLTRPSPIVVPEPVVVTQPRYVEVLPPTFVAQSCSVEGCGHDTTARGLCQKHYARFLRRAGDVGGADDLPRQTPRGTSHPGSKVNEEIVREIRASSESGVSLAAKFGITPTLVSGIRKRKVWKHVE